MKVHIDTTLDLAIAQKAREHKIQWSEAMRVGIGVILAERGDDTYVSSLNVYRKINRLTEILEQTTKQLEDFKK